MLVIHPRRRTFLEFLAWLGLLTALLQLAAHAASPDVPVVVAFGPADLSSWADAIGHTIEVLTMAAGALVIAWHRWRRGDDDEPPETPLKPAV